MGVEALKASRAGLGISQAFALLEQRTSAKVTTERPVEQQGKQQEWTLWQVLYFIAMFLLNFPLLYSGNKRPG